jgi:hypothetical protein
MQVITNIPKYNYKRGDKMTIFSVETWIVKPDKLSEFKTVFKKYETWMKKHPELFKDVKSIKVFSHMLGGNWGGYVYMTEYENLADFEKSMNKSMKSDFMTTIYPEFASLIAPGSYSTNIWNSVP